MKYQGYTWDSGPPVRLHSCYLEAAHLPPGSVLSLGPSEAQAKQGTLLCTAPVPPAHCPLPIFPSGCEGKLGVALESLQGRRDLT